MNYLHENFKLNEYPIHLFYLVQIVYLCMFTAYMTVLIFF